MIEPGYYLDEMGFVDWKMEEYSIYDMVSLEKIAEGNNPNLKEYDDYRTYIDQYPTNNLPPLNTINVELFIDDDGVHLR